MHTTSLIQADIVQLGRVSENIERAKQLCSRLEPNTVDLVCLPEMIFSGYVFRSAAAILPYLEYPQTGPTSQFCSELASRLRCYVAAGYPERLVDEEKPVVSEGHPVPVIGANSAVIYGPDGFIGGYRKTHLFAEDKHWAKAGTGFSTFHLPSPLNTLTIGICMDLNPQSDDWSLRDGPYELAQHCVATKSNVLLMLNAWLDSQADTEETCDWQTLNYWAARLRPLWCESNDGHDTSDDRDTTTVVMCNRAGHDEDITFAGTSALFRMSKRVGKPVLHEVYGRQDETVEIWFTES